MTCKKELKTIRAALEKIQVSGKENIDLMSLCMQALDDMITRCETEKEIKEHADD